MRQKTCKGCGDKYDKLPHHPPFQAWCGIDCGITVARVRQDKVRAKARAKGRADAKRADKAARATHRARKQALKGRGQWLKEAQAEFNKFCRARDRNQPCISCQRHHDGQYHAGHYMTVGGHPELRFNEDNCHKQCSACNNHLSGDIARYRVNLERKIGPKRLAALEGPHEPLKLTIDDIKLIKVKYRGKVKELLA
ncbi:MAG: recombination protein NinG [Gammaproteobacteria bacterium]|nr:MAG: recombination protein NinG [Gammaproteobacteria bacterium]